MPSFTVLESSSITKASGRPCEDAVVVTDAHAAVIDGATTPHAIGADGRTSGRVAADALVTAVRTLPADATLEQFLTHARETIANDAALSGMDPEMPTAVAVVYSAARRELWVIGDAHWHVEGVTPPADRRRVVDDLAIAARAVILRAELAQGATVEELRQDDPGRAGTAALRAAKAVFRNREDAGELGFAVLTGHIPTPVSLTDVIVVPAGAQVVLASDGYVGPAATLAQAERELHAAMEEDPLCIGELAATKCPTNAHAYFDDRTYLRLVHPA